MSGSNHRVLRPLFGLHERLMGRPTFRYLAELERTQWLAREELEALQMRKLKTLLHSALQHCPWHAGRIENARLDLRENSAPLTMADLRRLPTMNATDAKDNREQLVWRGAPGGVFRYTTGGSSGNPLVFYYGRSRQASDAASRMRARKWWGLGVGDREVFLWGSPVELTKTDLIKKLRDRLFNQLLLNAFEMSRKTMDLYIAAIRDYKPNCIYGYASSLALLSAYAKELGTNLKISALRVVCTTGEPLYADQRSLINETFGVPVANEFGSRDVGFIAHESPQEQLLVTSENVILEALDQNGQPAKPGEVGEAVMTGLTSEAQPFIRYKTGDLIRVSKDNCKKGRGLHVIDEVIGRDTDFLVRSDGTVMHALSVIYVLRDCDGVSEFKIIQHEVHEVEVQVVPNGRWTESTKKKIVDGIKARFDNSVDVEVQLLDSVAPTPSGKHRYVVTHVPTLWQ